ncbi:MAG TPA: HEAT repeat domain-containing protein [Planctomycetota bacterium]|jgi:CheY-like chemotaxis protein
MIGRTRVLAAVLVAAVCACYVPTSARAEEDKTAQIEKLFREGVDLYQQGKYADAQRKLKDVMALDPRNEIIARLVEEAGARVMAQMMANVRMGNEPTYIWQSYRKYQVRKLADKERMAKMAQRLVEPTTTEDERALLYREFGELGHYSIPIIAPYLKDATHEDYRTNARIAIGRMGPRAVLPVIELLAHKDPLMRENAVLILAEMQPLDPRGIPALKARVEDANEQPSIKNYAARALQRITGIEPAKMRTAPEYYYDLANRYFLDRAGVAEEAEDIDGMVWHLNDAGDLVSVQYPLWAWNEQMAEDNVLKGLALASDNPLFLSLWASVQAAEYTEVKDLLDICTEQPAQNSFSAEEKKEIEAWDKKLIDCKRLIAAVGKENVNAALAKVHVDLKKYPGHSRLPQVGCCLAKELAALDPTGELLTPPPEVTVEAIPGKDPVIVKSGGAPVAVKTEGAIVKVTLKKDSVEVYAIPTVDPTLKNGKKKDESKEEKKEAVAEPKKEEGKDAAAVAVPLPPSVVPPPPTPVSTSALVNGLDSADESVQYACALALASIDRFPTRWIGSEKVGTILGRGVGEDRPPQILIVEENLNAANELRAKLDKMNFGVTLAASGRDALVIARSFPPKDIAIISDVLRRDLSAEQLIEELKADVRTRYMPASILHANKDRTLIQSRFGMDIPLVEREMAGNDLKVAVDGVLAKRAGEAAPKRKAREVAVACATALTKIDPRDTNIVLDDAVVACTKALFNRPDDVRNPAAVFLGRIEGGKEKKEVADKLKAVFLDANNAVELRRNALRSLGYVQKEGLEEIYVKAQSEADQEIKDIAAEALGQVSRSGKLITDFLRANRIEKDKKEK